MSGNGVRCVAAFLHHKNWTTSKELEIRTSSGRKIYTLVGTEELSWRYRSLMGEPVFLSSKIPFAVQPPAERVQDFPLDVRGETVRVTALWVGNPQCAVLVDELPEGDLFLRLGSALECHPMFPERTNVSFVKVEGPHEIRIRIYERGVGPTHSSGTGSCGAAVTSLIAGKVESPVEVTTATGTQTVEWTPGQEIVLTGSAALVGDVEFCWRTGD
jgi:diaminopimelate epimerase